MRYKVHRLDVKGSNIQEKLELFKEENEYVLDLATRGVTLNLEKEEIEELKKLLNTEL